MTDREAASTTASTTTTVVSVTVGIDREAAFVAFTEEMDDWWVRGPINYFDFARTVAMRCEPGVGGRILEVHDAATGEGKERARITAWEPGKLLAWQSSVDDVAIEVRFEEGAGQGETEVSVRATIPEGGADRGGTAWLRVTPQWFGSWCERRASGEAQRPQPPLARLGVGLAYERPAAAARWLRDVAGLTPASPLPTGDDPLPETEHGHPWIELRAGASSLVVLKADRSGGPRRHPTEDETWVYVDDLDAHFARLAQPDSGGSIVEPIHEHGFRAYVAEDPEGHRFVFVQAPPAPD